MKRMTSLQIEEYLSGQHRFNSGDTIQLDNLKEHYRLQNKRKLYVELSIVLADSK